MWEGWHIENALLVRIVTFDCSCSWHGLDHSLGRNSTHIGTIVRIPKNNNNKLLFLKKSIYIYIISKYYKYLMSRLNQGV